MFFAFAICAVAGVTMVTLAAEVAAHAAVLGWMGVVLTAVAGAGYILWGMAEEMVVRRFAAPPLP